jgi:hypothetical protein
MGGGFQALAQAGVQNAEAQAQQKRDMVDEQRKTTLKTLLDDATTPQDKLAAIQAVYHQDPGVLKQHVENMTRKLTGKPSQPVVAPQQAQQTRIGQLAPGKTPDQQALDQQKALAAQQLPELAATGKVQNQIQSDADQQKQQSTLALIDKYITDPEQNKAAKQEFAQKQAGIFGQPKPLTGAAGQPVEFPPGSGLYAKAVSNPDGTTAMVPMPEGWKPVPPKQSMTPRVGTSGGKNVYALLTPKGWVDAGTQAPLKDFRPLPTYAQTGTYRVEPMQNPDGSITSALLNGKTGQFKPLTSTDGQPIAPSLMAQVNQSLEPAIAGDTRLNIMQQNEKDALAGNQQAMLSLVANHIGMTLGAQKGARINQAVWNEAIASAPWLQSVEAKWGPDGYLSGVTITPQQIHQMVGLAKQRRDAQWQQAAQAGKMYGVNIPMPDDLGGAKPAPKKSTMSDDDFLLKVK